ESGLDVFGASHHPGAGERILHVPAQHRGQRINHRAKQEIDFFLEAEDQLAVMPADALHRVAAIHGAAAFAEIAKLFFGSVRAEDDVFGADAQVAQKSDPELVSAPDVQNFGDADADSGAVFRR